MDREGQKLTSPKDTASGVCVCMHCFQAGCVGDKEHSHAGMHYQKTGHALALWIRRTPKPAEPVTRLAVVERAEEDQYNYERHPVCLACDHVHGRRIQSTEAVQAVANGIVNATSSAHKIEVQAWEEDIVPCQHTQELRQDITSPPLLGKDAACSRCELDTNLWMCLQCGHLGCGRAQFGGIQGHSHALAHFEQTGHPCSVKQGTITPEGTGDVYCYACNDARIDPNLNAHLQRLGVPVATLSKTEKSMTELQLEQNISFEFSMVDENGNTMKPAYGPGRTGIQNLGNSCYMASVLQAVWSLPTVRHRYASIECHAVSCTEHPAQCFECQLRKLTYGLVSGRYATGEKPRGIKPSMFKSLMGQGHPEFASMRQQDAEEFLQHLVTRLGNESSRTQSENPTRVFSYVLEHRLQCNSCHKVRYTDEPVEACVGLPVPVKETSEAGVYEPVSFAESLDAYTAAETLEYSCPSCGTCVEATKQTRFATLPDVLVVQAQRFQLIHWVPQKVPVPFKVPLSQSMDLSAYLGKGLQIGEEELPEDSNSTGVNTRPIDKVIAPDVLATLVSFGFNETQAQHAWQATGGDLEASANWLFEHGDEVNTIEPPAATDTNPDVSTLEDMGFTRAQAKKAMRLQGNVEMAVSWLFEHPNDAGDLDILNEEEKRQSGTAARAGSRDAPANYELTSFVTHRGPSVHSGHYVAHVKDGNDWVFFNDEKVMHAPMHGTPSSVGALSEMAYLYFFRRV